jgi:aspartate beta-hydroxylase
VVSEERLIAFLADEGAERSRHARRRTLLDHLVGTCEIVRRWNQPRELQYAALIHSVYGTDVYEQPLLPLPRRTELIELAGEGAERLAYLFSVIPRETLFAGTHRWARDLPVRISGADDAPARRDELDALVLLHAANLAEQKTWGDAWLVRLRRLGELLMDSDSITLPAFVAQLIDFSDADEALLQRAYAGGLTNDEDGPAATSQMALAAAICPVVPEPCIWQAYLAHRAGDGLTASSWARQAQQRLAALGATWDKRLAYGQWLELARAFDAPAGLQLDAVADPRALYEAISSPRLHPTRGEDSGLDGDERFRRYVNWLADTGDSAPLGVYPDLASKPWYDPADFPLACYLESHFEQIRQEVLALDPSRFQRESERIRRSGDWDVMFLYERGRRRDDVCDACPVTARGIETHETMRTAAGLIYVSRMRANTHIQAHRGPTNLRLRCHLGITVPSGDCAIRVGNETHQWSEGRCLVFDDHFEHEAWNHTAEERIVLIADIWHPALTATEVRLLEGLHRYAYTYARQLGRYWATNAKAARASDDVGDARPASGTA